VGTFYQLLLILGFIVAVLFSLIVLFTGKGDAMSGGGSVRTTFKGKASFDDIMSRIAFGFGIAFMAITLLLNAVASRYPEEIGSGQSDFKTNVDLRKDSGAGNSKSSEPAPESKNSKP
jgi:preprotein translocase subunit SecG